VSPLLLTLPLFLFSLSEPFVLLPFPSFSRSPLYVTRDSQGGSWSLVSTSNARSQKSWLQEAASRITPDRIQRGPKSIPAGAVFLGGFWRIIKVTKDKNGRPHNCSLVIDDNYNVIIEGSRDPSPLREPKLGYEFWKLADALICTLVYPEETKKMLAAMPKQDVLQLEDEE
jgi:hypothetical protein